MNEMNGWFGDIGDWFTDRATDVVEFIGDTNAEFQKKVAELKTKAAEFTAVFNKLDARKKQAESSPEISREYDDVMGSAGTIKKTIENVLSKIDAAHKWIMNGIPGSNGLAGANGMGALPLIAIVVGAITAITKWLSDAYKLDRKLDSVESQIAAGVDPVTAGKNAAQEKSLINVSAAGLMPLAIGGVLLYFLWPTIKRKMQI